MHTRPYRAFNTELLYSAFPLSHTHSAALSAVAVLLSACNICLTASFFFTSIVFNSFIFYFSSAASTLANICDCSDAAKATSC